MSCSLPIQTSLQSHKVMHSVRSLSTRPHSLLLNKLGMAELLWAHVVHMGNGQAAERPADELNVITLHIPHHQDLGLGLHSKMIYHRHIGTSRAAAVTTGQLPHSEHPGSFGATAYITALCSLYKWSVRIRLHTEEHECNLCHRTWHPHLDMLRWQMTWQITQLCRHLRQGSALVSTVPRDAGGLVYC